MGAPLFLGCPPFSCRIWAAMKLTTIPFILALATSLGCVGSEPSGGTDAPDPEPREEFHPVDGVGGDWAMYVAEHDMVRAFRGGQVLEVSSVGAEEAQVVDLATRAMARLP